ncbi:hypothetical protein PsorP6_006300 [Peronosclerospora sorghi]|uniref:Uncharacterized protein n=1 Tax=Peronosclerospora sorghi TaxID=230839 RepID=A0ACC0W4I5_9STRA|nr:hypothetical protein PsorP6_006300 [Peronosclerospora sorghi]
MSDNKSDFETIVGDEEYLNCSHSLQDIGEVNEAIDDNAEDALVELQSHKFSSEGATSNQCEPLKSRPRSVSSLGNIVEDDEDMMEMNAREQELLVNIQEF